MLRDVYDDLLHTVALACPDSLALLVAAHDMEYDIVVGRVVVMAVGVPVLAAAVYLYVPCP